MSDRRFKRKLTPFLCQEMLYDYAIDALDPERRQAIEEFLPTDAESQRILAAIKNGFAYSKKLSQFEVAGEVLDRLDQSQNLISIHRSLSAAKKIPLPKMKHLGLTATFLALLIGIVLIPWSKIFLQLRARHKASPPPVVESMPSATPVVSLVVPAPAEATPTLTAEANADSSTLDANDGDDSGVVQAVTTPVATPLPKVVAQSEVSAHPKGFVFRAFMTLPDPDAVADEIIQKIQDDGAVKAGEVELGWKKGNARYYHFALPEENQEKLLEELRAYGPVRISKDPHPRVMPKGKVRFILWIDSEK
jgi:hypothetical protein